jgi:chemotaxis protein histidine kinase CheA
MPLPDIALEENDEMPLPDIALEESDEPLALDMETESASAEGGEDSLLDALDVLGGGADDDGGSMDDMLAALDDSFAEAAQEDAISDADIGDIDLNALDALTEDGAEEGAADNIDSMLDGLLDNLDMNGSIEEPDTADADTADAKTEEEDGMLDFLGLDDMSENAEEETEELLNVADMIPDAEAPEEEKKPGFFKRVFGNVVTDEIAEQERLAAQQEEEELAKKAEEDAKAKEEKAAAQEEKKAQKAAAKEEKKKQKEAQKAEKAQKKAEKKAQREEEAPPELEVVGKLNKVGVSIIAIATILFLTVEIAGTNTFGYVSSKNKALDYFDMGKYTEAYAEAIGTNMRDKDAEEYNKIKVVMKVQQSLNAYQNYDRVKYYPEALDALLRGLKRYDANIDEAIELEVDGDMMSCRKQILTLLKEEFNLSEAQAYSILALDKEAYQSKVVALGLKKK